MRELRREAKAALLGEEHLGVFRRCVIINKFFFLQCSWFLEEKDLKYEWISLTYTRFCSVF
jgi:hypothetical protein